MIFTNYHYFTKEYCNTPPICIAIRPPIRIAVLSVPLITQEREILQYFSHFGGKEVYTKGVFSSENSSASTGKKEVWCMPKSLFSRGHEGVYIYIYTPKSLQGVVGDPFAQYWCIDPILLPFVLQYASHLYRDTPPICVAMLLGNLGGCGHRHVPHSVLPVGTKGLPTANSGPHLPPSPWGK